MICSQWDIHVHCPGGYLVQKILRGCAANMGSKISLWYMNDPLKNAKSDIWMGRFFKIWPNLSQNWLKFKKILEKIGNFVQNLGQNFWPIGIWMGYFFLEKLVFVWVYFQIPWAAHPYQNQTWVPPWGSLVLH